MDPQQRIDKILTSSLTRIQEEVGALLGTDFKLTANPFQHISKAQFFEERAGKQILAKVAVSGEVEGDGCLLMSIRDAIRLGGTLIMLPASELDEFVAREEYSEEIEDSFGEIANIISGSLTKTFEEMYPKPCRLVRKEQYVILPAKVAVESPDPIADQPYYQLSAQISLGGKQLGALLLLLPAVPFALVSVEAAAVPSAEEVPASSEQQTAAPAAAETPSSSADTASNSAAASAPASGPASAETASFDVDKQKKRVDKLLQAAQAKLSVEVSALIGAEIKFSNQENRLVSKEQFFQETLAGQQVVAAMEVVGDRQDSSHLFFPLKTAIQLGGTLIMLPDSELEAVMASEDFSEDNQDAFSEVANIISGVYTSLFEEQYSEKLRFIKKGISTLKPMQVDIPSAEPVADRLYYLSSMESALGGKPLDRMHMLFPAAMLRLESLAEESPAAVPEQPAAAVPPVGAPAAQAVPAAPVSNAVSAGGVDSAKQKKLVDSLLAVCTQNMQAEVASLLGAEVKLTDPDNRLITKESFFHEEQSGKLVMAELDVLGDLTGKSYLFCTLKDAIHLGGTLIMLPPSELEIVVAEDDFNTDTEDAFGEVANIIAGVYSGVFEERYTKKLRFVKTALQHINPPKVEVSSAQPVPDELYYLTSMQMQVDDKELGRVQLLFPARLLELGQTAGSAAAVAGPAPAADNMGAASNPSAASTERQGIDVLLISDDDSQAELIAGVVASRGLRTRKISYKENLYNFIPGELQAVYLVMREVNEQAFGIAIKLSSTCSLPVIAAGPGWTRSKVIKAVKYGVSDILLTPASDAQIAENLQNNLLRQAA